MYRSPKRQSVKFSYSDGELARIGGTFQTVSCAWQYSWLGKRDRRAQALQHCVRTTVTTTGIFAIIAPAQ